MDSLHVVCYWGCLYLLVLIKDKWQQFGCWHGLSRQMNKNVFIRCIYSLVYNKYGVVDFFGHTFSGIQYKGLEKGLSESSKFSKCTLHLYGLNILLPTLSVLMFYVPLNYFTHINAVEQHSCHQCSYNSSPVLSLGTFHVQFTSPFHWWPLCTRSPILPTSPPCPQMNFCPPMLWL